MRHLQKLLQICVEAAIMKHKHLTYEDRLIIQRELENSTSLHNIAPRLHKSDSTISREIVRDRYQVKTSANHSALCAMLKSAALKPAAPLPTTAVLQRYTFAVYAPALKISCSIANFLTGVGCGTHRPRPGSCPWCSADGRCTAG